MPTIKDKALLELALRGGAIPAERLEQGAAAQAELERFRIGKPLAAVLAEKGLAPKEAIAAVLEDLAAFAIRCQECGKPNLLADADRNGQVRCKHCGETVQHPEGRISEDDLSRALVPRGRGRRDARTGAAARTERKAPGGAPGSAPARPSRGPAEAPGACQDELAARAEVTKVKLQKLLGVSPAGKLYAAKDGPHALCVKVLDRALGADKARLKSWSDFMQRVQDLPRSATPRPVQLFREGSVAYTVRGFLGDASSSLRSMIGGGAEGLSAEAIAERARSILDAVAAFHAAHLVHGNLKPENVIFAADAACLADPGLWILYAGLEPEERVLRLSDASRYCAPEVLQGSEPSPASDLFSAGRCMEDLLLAAPERARTGPLLGLVATLTAADPTERPPSAREACKWLETGAHGRGKAAAGRTPPPAPGPERGRRFPRPGPRALGRAALVLAASLLAFQAVSWHRTRTAFGSAERAEDLTGAALAREMASLAEWTAASGAGRAAAEARWTELRELLAGTRWEVLAAEASAKALSSLPDPAAREVDDAAAQARSALAAKDWPGAIEAILRVEGRLGDSRRSGALRELLEQALEQLYRADGMVLVPSNAEAGSRPFLADATLVSRAGAPLTGVSLPEAEKIAAGLGKRLLTQEEWDRMAAFAAGAGPSWAASGAAKIEAVRGGPFQWIADAPEDGLSRAGYGACRGGDRSGVPPTHPLRRKRLEGHLDVGLRFARSLTP